jgi:arylsulfatase A-like enzyme
MAPRDLSGCLNTSCYGFSTTPSPGYPMYNILMIIVDQMRAPRWIPTNTPLGSGLPGQEALDAIMPSIASIRKQSYVFANYNVAATDCSPCRATLLTGLYSQQTCIFATQDGPTNPNLPFPPSLQPWNQMVGGVLTPGQGFPTIGDVLSQSNPALNYDCVWIGKWHLSDNPQESESQYVCNPGRKGPSDYGFQDAWCIPTPPTGGSYPWPYPSPSGLSSHEGASGNFGNFTGNTTVGDPVGSNDVPYYNANTDTPPYAPGLTPPSYNQLNDAATASAFATWINSHAPTANKWFAAVSFINPHDITQFPYSFDLTQGSPCTAPTGDFCSPLPSIRTRPGSSHR